MPSHRARHQPRLIEASLSPALSRQRHGHHRRNTPQLAGEEPSLAGWHRQQGGEPLTTTVFERMQALANAVSIRSRRSSMTKATSRSPTGATQAGLHTVSEGQAASRTIRGLDGWKTGSAGLAQGPVQGSSDGCIAQETGRRKTQSPQAVVSGCHQPRDPWEASLKRTRFGTARQHFRASTMWVRAGWPAPASPSRGCAIGWCSSCRSARIVPSTRRRATDNGCKRSPSSIPRLPP